NLSFISTSLAPVAFAAFWAESAARVASSLLQAAKGTSRTAAVASLQMMCVMSSFLEDDGSGGGGPVDAMGEGVRRGRPLQAAGPQLRLQRFIRRMQGSESMVRGTVGVRSPSSTRWL